MGHFYFIIHKRGEAAHGRDLLGGREKGLATGHNHPIGQTPLLLSGLPAVVGGRRHSQLGQDLPHGLAGPFLRLPQGFQGPLASLFLPGVELPYGHPMTAAHFADRMLGLPGLLDDPQFLFGRPATAILSVHGSAPPGSSL